MCTSNSMHALVCEHVGGSTWAVCVRCTHTHTPWLPCTHISFLAPREPAALSPARAILPHLRGDDGGSSGSTGGRSPKLGRGRWWRGRRSLMRPPSLPAWELVPLIIVSVSSSPGKSCCRSPALSLPWDPFPHLPTSRKTLQEPWAPRRRADREEGQCLIPPGDPECPPACLPAARKPTFHCTPLCQDLVSKRLLEIQLCSWRKESLRTLTSPITNNERAPVK